MRAAGYDADLSGSQKIQNTLLLANVGEALPDLPHWKGKSDELGSWKSTAVTA